VLAEIVEQCREEILRKFPPGTRVGRPEGGFVLWVQLPEGFDGVDLQHRALDADIRILPGTVFAASGRYRNCIRIACGYPFERMKPAIRTLASLLER